MFDPSLQTALAVIATVASAIGIPLTLYLWKPKGKGAEKKRYLVWFVSVLGFACAMWFAYLFGASRQASPPFVAQEERNQVLSTIEDASDLETNTFRNPQVFDVKHLHRLFLPAEEGGEIVGTIMERVRFLRERGLHYGEGTRLLQRGFPEICVNGEVAFAKGTESWRLVLRDSQSEALISDKVYTDTAQVYQLVKRKGHWYVKWSNTRYRQTAAE